MDLPAEICFEIFSYLPVYPIMNFRIVSKDTVEYAKRFKGSRLRVKSIKKWNTCFPEATQANLSGVQVCLDDLPYLTHVKDLDLSLCCPYRERNTQSFGLSWFRLPGVKKLTLMGNIHMTDEWLSHFTELEDLSLSHMNLNGSGFRNMKLKRLSLISMSRIKDQALMGLELEDLTIVSNRHISDEGIRQVVGLKKIYLSWVRQVNWVGYEHLPLKEVFLSEIDVTREVFQSIAGVPDIVFSQCHFLETAYELLTKLEYLNLYQCTFEETESMTKLLDLEHLKQVHLTRCPALPPLIQEKMGPRLKLTHREKWP